MNLRIAAFITASTLAHGGGAVWLSANPMPHLTVGGEAQALRVALLPFAQTAVDTPPPQTTKPHAREATQTAHKPQLQTAEVKPQPATVSAPPAPGSNAATPPHSTSKHVSEYISAALKNRLARDFVYPWLARQRGWQGRVLLSLHVASNGDLSNWKVVGTSGYQTLDQSALKAAQRIENLPQAKHWLNGSSLEVRLPVQYKLFDS